MVDKQLCFANAKALPNMFIFRLRSFQNHMQFYPPNLILNKFPNSQGEF
jgi:hypothetical protein